MRRDTRALTHAAPQKGTLLHLAARVTSWGLRRDEPLLEAPLDDDQWDAFLSLAAEHRVTGLLWAAARTGLFPLTAGQVAALRELHHFSATRVLYLERVLADTVTKFDAASIRHRVLKGAALAYCVYDDPGVRPYADVDLLVPSADFDRAIALLTADSARRVRGEPRPGFVRRFGKSVELIRSDGISIDLHRSLAPRAWAVLIDADAMFDSRVRFTVAGRDFCGLGPAERFIHASFHATVGSGSLRLLSLRDVVQTALSPDLDPQGARALAARWQATSVIAAAVSLAWRVLEPSATSELADWAAAFKPSRRDRRLLAQHTVGDDDPGTREALEMVRAVPGIQGKVRYLAALLNPSRAYLAERGQTRSARMAHGLRLLVPARRRRQPPSGNA